MLSFALTVGETGPDNDFLEPLTVVIPRYGLAPSSAVEPLEPLAPHGIIEAPDSTADSADAIVAVVALPLAFQRPPLFMDQLVPVPAHPLAQFPERSRQSRACRTFLHREPSLQFPKENLGQMHPVSPQSRFPVMPRD